MKISQSISLDLDLVTAAKEAAHERHVSLSGLVSNLLVREIHGSHRPEALEPARDYVSGVPREQLVTSGAGGGGTIRNPILSTPRPAPKPRSRK